ncbi:MAG: DUF6544 family protein [Chloroflexota bacterium]|nr:DUF6544 family protein [Chloroflexota bacterium]
MLGRILIAIVGTVAALFGVCWLGLRVPAPAFPSDESAGTATTNIPIPTGLPAPVERFARVVYGDMLPQAQMARVSGHATVTMNGITMPARFRFSYDMARGHYHEIQVTWFALPVMSIHERYLDGHAILDIPIIGRVENDPNTDAASRQGFWAELLAWVPALAIGDPRVRWQAIDDTSARMYVPGADDADAFTLHFDPATGYMTELRAMRYSDSEQRRRWQPSALKWDDLHGTPTMVRSSIHWDDDAPWVMWDVEDVVLGANVSARLERFGG